MIDRRSTLRSAFDRSPERALGSGFVPRVLYWLPFGHYRSDRLVNSLVDSLGPWRYARAVIRACRIASGWGTISPTFSSDFSEAASEEKLMLIRSVPEGRMDASAARFAHQAIYAFSRRPLRHPSRPRGSRAVDLSPLPDHSKRRGKEVDFGARDASVPVRKFDLTYCTVGECPQFAHTAGADVKLPPV